MSTPVLVKVTLTAVTGKPQISKTQHITYAFFAHAAKSNLVFLVV